MREVKYFLVGMPASGKSTLGKLIAKQLGLEFIDLDKEIVLKERMAITDIFQAKGENYFREVERKCLKDQLDRKENFVLATGGGAPCFFDNMAQMNQNGLTIFLSISVDDLFSKLSEKGIQKRPLLKGINKEDLYTELKNKLDYRKKYYEQSKITVNQDDRDINERVNQLIFELKTLKK